MTLEFLLLIYAIGCSSFGVALAYFTLRTSQFEDNDVAFVLVMFSLLLWPIGPLSVVGLIFYHLSRRVWNLAKGLTNRE